MTMAWLDYVSYFFGGAFLANALPHFISGVMGRSFQSPFAKPPGQGLSSSTVNVLWGSFNLVVAYVLLGRVGRFDLLANADAITAGAGLVLASVMLARSFGRFHGGHVAKGS
jgi:hypothetical protein